ncbi:MAG TPA: patatin family protein [Methanocorpusculum sp.]|nr:patatin family protein [Methanocorpusculum sp.]
MKTSKLYQAGLILEGGGMRGGYTTGVIDCFLDNGIDFSSIYAVSSGACHATSYISKQYNRAFRISTNYIKDWHYCSVRSLLVSGNLFGTKMLFDRLHNELDLFDYDTFAKYPGKFFVVATCLETGMPEYFPVKIEDMAPGMPKINASSSMPWLAKIVEIDGKHYLDGCVADSIPLKKSEEDGNLKNVAVLTRPRDYRKKPNRLLWLFKMRYHKYPDFLSQCASRHLRYNACLEYAAAQEAAGRTFVIAPEKPLSIGAVTHSREKLEELYHIGYNDTAKRMDNLLSFLGSQV